MTMNLTKNQYKFDPKRLANETSDAYSADSFNSWVEVARVLARCGFNVWEAEAILRSKWTRWCRDEFGEGDGKPNTANTLVKYLIKYNFKPGCKDVVELVMDTFGEEHNLELNEDGVPCRRGSMPGNPTGGTILVPLGTPLCCDPTSETYWSM